MNLRACLLRWLVSGYVQTQSSAHVSFCPSLPTARAHTVVAGASDFKDALYPFRVSVGTLREFTGMRIEGTVQHLGEQQRSIGQSGNPEETYPIGDRPRHLTPLPPTEGHS